MTFSGVSAIMLWRAEYSKCFLKEPDTTSNWKTDAVISVSSFPRLKLETCELPGTVNNFRGEVPEEELLCFQAFRHQPEQSVYRARCSVSIIFLL